MSDTLGKYLLDEAIPEKYRPEGPYTKKALSKSMVRMAKDDPDNYVRTISKVKKLGDTFATMDGISVGLDDIEPIYAERDKIIKPVLKQLQKETDINKRRKLISATQKKLQTYAEKHPGTMGMMARSGGRGNIVQLMKAVGSPVAAGDENDNVQPWMITKSYAEGLSASDWWAANREARMSAVKSNIEVTEPGDLSKILVNNMSNQLVTTTDCMTTNGLEFEVDDDALVERYLAKPAGTVAANTLLTPRVIETLKNQKVKTLLARSPMTCEARDGVCQKCAGRDTVGKVNPIGTNLGIRAAQSMGEPLTQLALDAKHGVRMAGKEHQQIGGLEGFRAIIETPSSFKYKATLAKKAGSVSKIEKAPQGGYYVWLGDERHYISQGLEPRVKKGQRVAKGDAISTGVPRPDEVVSHKGLGAGRKYIVDQLNRIYKGNGINVDRRHLETLAKAQLNYLKVDDVDEKDTAEHGLVRGDIVDYNKYRAAVETNKKEVSLDKAVGEYLGQGALHHLAGTKITPEIKRELSRAGFKKVVIGMNAPKVTPIMAPATRNPLLNPDFIGRLGFRYLKKTVLEAAHRGDQSQIHGLHPVPAILDSREFGKGKDGRY